MMLALLLTVTLGIIFAIFGTQNTEVVTLNFGDLVISLPTYLAIFTPLVLGLAVSYIIYIALHLSQKLTINEHKDKIKKLNLELAEVTKAAHKLQLENLKLKKDLGLPQDGNSI